MWRLSAAVAASALAAGVLAGCGQPPYSRPAARQTGVTPAPRGSARAAGACRSPRRLSPGALVTGAELAAVDFLTSSAGIGLTSTVASCTVSLGPGQGDEVYTPRQTSLLAVSRDGGLTWTTQGAAIPMTGSGPDQIALVSASRVWAASPAGQLFGTRDDGLSWQRQLPGLQILSLATADGTVWAAGCPTAVLPCAVRIEIARAPGWRWQERPVSAAGSSRLMLSANPRLIPLSATAALLLGQVTGSQVRLLRTSDSGLTWSAIALPRTAAWPVAVSVVARSWFLLSSLGSGMDHAKNVVFRSTDSGRTWSAVSADTSAFGPEPQGAPGPVDAGALAAASKRTVWLANTDQLQASEDAGTTWRDVPDVDLAGAGSVASFDVLNATHAWLLGWLGGLWRTTDGTHWELCAAR